MEMLLISQIRTDGGTQPRAELNESVVEDYADAMGAGAEFPPVTVFYDGCEYWLADGFHRVHAACVAERTEIAADVRQGTKRDAILYSVGANAAHGLRRTNRDKRRAVETCFRLMQEMTEDGELGASWSDSDIARRCAVSHTLVGRMRADLSCNGCKTDGTRTVQRGGNTYQQNTANIGGPRPVRTGPGTAPQGQSPKPPAGGISPEALSPVRGHSLPERKTALSMPHDPAMGARTLLSVFEPDYLVAMVQELLAGLPTEALEALADSLPTAQEGAAS